jgi:predicted dehydrogenase
VISLEGSARIHITDVVEPDRDRAVAFSAARGVTLHGDLASVLSMAEIDAIMIVTPHRLHPEQALAAFEAGKHVFCEKPLALDAESARRMVAAGRARGLQLGIGHERRFEGALEEVARMVGAGKLGILSHIECNWSHNLFMGAPASTWRQDPSQAPAGTLTALGVHITDFFQSVAGPVAEVRAVSAHRSRAFPADDVISVQFRFVSGVTGTMTNIATTPFYSRISVFGDAGWVEARESSNVDVPEPALLTWRGMDNEIHTRTYAHSDTVRANAEQWAGAALGIDTYRFDDEQLLHNVEILEAVVRSARDGAVVTVG